ncbi:hypothetical protein LPJ61_004699 [Coemansia biformis]|uniref:RRM domain-containing protein n=1 Tax=Coemansia biformis TaxID=1286918 RepID=A0A9W7Y8S3_9FUNG|nr:hypothetical protein LPJ61_004699 [Coemansia biformis]
MAHFAPYTLPRQGGDPSLGLGAVDAQRAAPPDPVLHGSSAAYARMPALPLSHSQAQLSSILAQPPASAPMHYAALLSPAQHQHHHHHQQYQHPALQARLVSVDPALSAPDGRQSAMPTPALAMASPAQHYHLHAQHIFAPVPTVAPATPMAAGLAPGPAVQLWMGDVEPWMDDECIRRIWACLGEQVAVKTIRDRLTGASANYCFIELSTHAEAERVLASYNGRAMPRPFDRQFRLNWASSVVVGGPGSLVGGTLLAAAPPAVAYVSATSWAAPLDSGLGAAAAAALSAPGATSADAPEFSLFVGDLAPEITDNQLAHEFRCRYASVRTAKVVTDLVTLLPRGYGFVRFGDEGDHQRALVEMQGHIIGSRAIRVSTATPKRTSTSGPLYGHHQYSHQPLADGLPSRDETRSPASSVSSTDSNALYNPATDPFNTTVFVGGLMHPVGEDELHMFFAAYGEVVYCKIPPNRGCGFVTFAKRANAEAAMRALNGHMLSGSRVRLSWGRSQNHARHNYRHHRHSNRHHHNHHSGSHYNLSQSGSGSGATSHRNSVSEHHGLYSRRSTSFGKGILPAASVAAQSSSAGLGLGLSGAHVLQQHGLTPIDTAAAGAVYAAVPGLAAQMQPSPAFLGSAYVGPPLAQHQHQQHQQHQLLVSDHGLAPHSAFYALSPIHPAAASGMEAFGGEGGVRGDTARSGVSGTPLGHALSGYHQQPGYYYPQQHPQHHHHHHLQHQQHQHQLQFQQPVLAMDGGCSAQLDTTRPAPLEARGPTPALAPCPSEVLTRRLSALTLSNSAVDPPPPTLDRRPSAGVIGQHRLSSKSSFGQQSGPPRKTPSQLSLAQLWPQGASLGDSCPGATLAAQVADYHGALSTPASSARLSASSVSLMALHSAGGRDGDAETRASSARPSMDGQPGRRGLLLDQSGFELGFGDMHSA